MRDGTTILSGTTIESPESERSGPVEGEGHRRLAIWGAGAMGGTLGAHLVRAGEDVVFVDTAADHVAAMRQSGLRISGPIADFRVPVVAVQPSELAARFDLVFLCVKSHHTAGAVRMVLPHLEADGVIVSVQNGLNEAVIAAHVGAHRTFGCFVNFGADYLEPGHIHYGGRGTVVAGEIDGTMTERGRAIVKLLRSFDERAILSSNVHGYLWSKLAYASMLFATALGDLSIADALAVAAHRALYVGLAREVIDVADARGIRLEAFDGFDPVAYGRSSGSADESIDALVSHNRRSAKTHSGIWRDLAVRQRATEVDMQVGAVVNAGRELGIAAPLNERLCRMIHEVEAGGRALGPGNLDELAATAAPISSREPTPPAVR